MNEKRIQSSAQIDRALTRLSHEILERNEGVSDVVLVGMHSRGVPLAKRIAETMRIVEEKDVYLGSLDISFFRGKNLPTSRTENVQVRLLETDGIDEVVIADGKRLTSE